jgi:hypothetical protein
MMSCQAAYTVPGKEVSRLRLLCMTTGLQLHVGALKGQKASYEIREQPHGNLM